MKKIGTLLAIVCCAYLKAQVCFAPLASYSVGSTPVNVTSADFNNDGIPDLATTNFYSNNVSILLATGTGSFSTATNFTVNSTPSCVISAHFDGDGKNDEHDARDGLGVGIISPKGDEIQVGGIQH